MSSLSPQPTLKGRRRLRRLTSVVAAAALSIGAVALTATPALAAGTVSMAFGNFQPGGDITVGLTGMGSNQQLIVQVNEPGGDGCGGNVLAKWHAHLGQGGGFKITIPAVVPSGSTADPGDNTWYKGYGGATSGASLAGDGLAIFIFDSAANPAVTSYSCHVMNVNFDSPVTATIQNNTASHTSPIVGDTLVAYGTGNSPNGGVTKTYAWTADGSPVGTNAATYAVTAADTGKRIRVKVTVSKTGYNDTVSTSDPTNPVINQFNDFNPTISGSGKAGEKLTVSTDTISPTPSSTTYAWTISGSATVRSTTSDFTPALSDAGKTATVTVTAKNNGAPADKALTATKDLTNGAGFTGAQKVGNTLTAVLGDGFGAADYDFTTYSDAACTADAADAGSTPLALTPAMAGLYVQLGDRGGNNGTCEGPIAPGTYDSFTASAYTGIVKVAETVTATDPSGLPEGASVAYSWTLDGTEVGTSKTYTLAQADAGKSLTLTETVSQTGYTTKSLTSSPAKVVAKGTFNPDAFSMTDSTPATAPTTGDTLTAVMDATKVPADTALTYSWGHAGDGGCTALSPAVTTSTYTVANSDAGSTMCVQIAATALGYNDGSIQVNASASSLGTFTAPTITFDEAPQVGVESQPVLTGLAPTDGVIYTYVWKVDGNQVATTQSYTPAQADALKPITVTVTSAKTNYVSDVSTSASDTKVKKGVFARMPVPMITGPAKVGQTLTRTAVELPSSPSGLAVSYAWGLQTTDEDDCLAIGNSTTTLTLARESKGQKVCVLATYSAPGYVTKAFTSALVGPIDGADLTVWRPVIDDTTPAIGDTLKASVSKEGYPADAEVAFGWGHKVTDDDGNSTCQVGSSTGTTYEVTAADLGDALCVVATVTADGFNAGSAMSRYTTAVPKLAMTGVSASISDTTPAVGDGLTASVSGAPSGATASYVWGVVTNGECDTTGGATSSSLSVPASLLGKQLCVVATVTADGYEDATVASAFTTSVAKATMTGLSVSVSDETPTYGDALTASVSGAPEGATVTYAWAVPTDAGCVIVDGVTPATSSSHEVTATEVGNKLCVLAYVSASGYNDATVSAATAKVTGKAFDSASVSGGESATVGVKSTLVASASPDADAVSYEWKVDGATVSASRDYTPVAADAGKAYTWSVVVSKAGYVAKVVTGSGTVAKGTFEAPSISLSATPTVGSSVTASVDLTGLPLGTSVTWQWYAAGDPATPILGAIDASYTPPAGMAGTSVFVKATVSAPGYNDASASSTPASVAKGTFTAPVVTVSNTSPQVGQTMSATASLSGAPSGTSAAYQWGTMVSGVCQPIEAATGSSYTIPVDAVVGTQYCVVATYSATGYDTVTSTSAGTAGVTAPTANVKYSTYLAKGGWGPVVADGAIAGAKGNQIQQLTLEIPTTYTGGFTWRAHSQTSGWSKWNSNSPIGVRGKRLEAIEIKLTGDLAAHYDITYQVMIKGKWMPLAKNGATAGTTGRATPTEAIKITLIKKQA